MRYLLSLLVLLVCGCGPMRLAGYATTYGVNASKFRASRPAYEGGLEPLLATRTLLFNHDKDQPVGHIESAVADDTGVFVCVKLARSARRVRRLIRQGAIRGFSIGLVPLETTQEYDARFGNITVIHRLLLFEVSVTPTPADWHCIFYRVGR